MEEQENQRVRLTRRLLQDALAALLEEKNLQEISVSELCAHAGINRSTFYAHYRNTRDLFEEMSEGFFGGLREQLERLAESTANTLSLGSRVEAICTYLQDNKNMAKLMFADSGHVSNFALETLSIPVAGMSFDELLESQYDEPTRKLLGVYLQNGTYQLIRTWIMEDIPKTPRDIGQLAEKVAYEGWMRRPK